MNGTVSAQKNIYRIKVKETIESSAGDRFNEMEVTPISSGETLITGRFIDQSALRGFLDQLWNLHFTVVSVDRLENGNHQPVNDFS